MDNGLFQPPVISFCIILFFFFGYAISFCKTDHSWKANFHFTDKTGIAFFFPSAPFISFSRDMITTSICCHAFLSRLRWYSLTVMQRFGESVFLAASNQVKLPSVPIQPFLTDLPPKQATRCQRTDMLFHVTEAEVAVLCSFSEWLSGEVIIIFPLQR